jgi:hypothetical protein
MGFIVYFSKISTAHKIRGNLKGKCKVYPITGNKGP